MPKPGPLVSGPFFPFQTYMLIQRALESPRGLLKQITGSCFHSLI